MTQSISVTIIIISLVFSSCTSCGISGLFTTGSCINYLARLLARCNILIVSLAFDGAITKLGAVL